MLLTQMDRLVHVEFSLGLTLPSILSWNFTEVSENYLTGSRWDMWPHDESFKNNTWLYHKSDVEFTPNHAIVQKLCPEGPSALVHHGVWDSVPVFFNM